MQKKRASINFEDRAIEMNLRPDRKKNRVSGMWDIIEKRSDVPVREKKVGSLEKNIQRNNG